MWFSMFGYAIKAKWVGEVYIYAANFVGKCSQVSISRAVLRDQTHPQHFGGVMRIVFSHLGIVCVAWDGKSVGHNVLYLITEYFATH